MRKNTLKEKLRNRETTITNNLAGFCPENPIVLIDVGASGGIAKRWQAVSKHLRVIGFEPDQRAFNELQSSGQIKYLNTALGSNDSMVSFFLTKRQMTSSSYKPNVTFLRQFSDYDRFTVTNEIRLRTQRLTSALLCDNDILDADFIKLDTQGSELDILRGAKDLLQCNIFGAEVEVEFYPLYQGQPLFTEVDLFMRENGFMLFDLRRCYWKRDSVVTTSNPRGQLIFADALYMKTYESFLNALHSREGKVRREKLFKAIVISMLYGKDDYGCYLAERACLDGFLSEQEKDALLHSLTQAHSVLPRRGRMRISRWLHALYTKIKAVDYYFMDEEIGNG